MKKILLVSCILISTQSLANSKKELRKIIISNKKKQHSKTVKLVDRYLKKFHKETYKEIKNLRKTGDIEDLEPSNRVCSLYYIRSKSLFSYLKKTEKRVEETVDKIKLDIGVVELCEKHETRAENLSEKVDEYLQNYIDSKYHTRWTLSLGRLYYKDTFTIVQSSGEKIEMIAEGSSTYVGLGYEFKNKKNMFSLEGQYSLGSSNTGTVDKSLYSNQQNVSVSSLLFTTGYTFYPRGEGVGFGVLALGGLKTGSYMAPSGGSVEGDSSTVFGLLGQALYEIKNYRINFRAGKMSATSGSTLSFGLSYLF